MASVQPPVQPEMVTPAGRGAPAGGTGSVELPVTTQLPVQRGKLSLVQFAVQEETVRRGRLSPPRGAAGGWGDAARDEVSRKAWHWEGQGRFLAGWGGAGARKRGGTGA